MCLSHKNSLIVGANSRIVGAIKPLLKDFDFVSHKDICSIDFSRYKQVFIFSWSRKSLQSNIEAINQVPGHLLNFISSTAVLSLQKRQQFSSYPANKKLVEDMVLGRGGKVTRLGVWGEGVKLHKYFGCVPITTVTQLAEYLNSNRKLDTGIVNLVSVERGQPSLLTKLCKVLYKISSLLPNWLVFQILLQGLPKILGVKSYGFTADANYFFNSEVLLGHGVLGGKYAKSTKSIERLVVASPFADTRLDVNGFKSTFVGLKNNGLAKYWHGVSIAKDNSSGVKKNIPVWVDRFRNISGAVIHGHVQEFFYRDIGPCIELALVDSRKSFITYLYAEKLVLACGPLENVRLLAKFSDSKFTQLSDHELALLGHTYLEHAVKAKSIRKLGPFVCLGRSLEFDFQNTKVLLDFRPFVQFNKNRLNKYNEFYLGTLPSILHKILADFSLHRINEAFFNKFGFSLATKKVSVFAQVLYPECITYGETGVLSRKRFSNDFWRSLAEHISDDVGEFHYQNAFTSIDSQHIVGAENYLREPSISKMLTSGALMIIGSPTDFRLSARHHTLDLSDHIMAKYSPNAL